MPVSPAPAAATAVVAPAPLADTAAGLTAAGWNDEAAVLLTELTATQREVAALLSGQAAAEQELTSMKESCSCELAELQEESWRLQMFAELEKMKGLISQLKPIEDDGNESGGSPKAGGGDGSDGGSGGKVASAAAGTRGAAPGRLGAPSPSALAARERKPHSPACRTAAAAPASWKQTDRAAAARQPPAATAAGDKIKAADKKAEQVDEAARKEALAQIDGELAALTAAIAAARDEVDGLMARKGDLTEEIAGVFRGEMEGDEEDMAVDEAVGKGEGSD